MPLSCSLLSKPANLASSCIKGSPLRSSSALHSGPASEMSGFVEILLCSALCMLLLQRAAVPVDAQGNWQLLVENAGIASMHTAVTHYGNVVMLDRTDVGPSEINLPDGVCRNDPNDISLKYDCTAHSVLFSPDSNNIRPLSILTDTWCSSGQFFPDGTLVQTGGDFDGLYKVRQFKPCPSGGTCDWVESTDESLQEGRWYSTNQLLPDNRQIVVGGRDAFTYEFIPANGVAKVTLPFLHQTQDNQNDNYYPFVHLLPDGNLFIFANRDSIVYNYNTETVVKTLPTIPGEPRNYPSGGSSVMLPLKGDDGYENVEILVCGGAQLDCALNPSLFPQASQTCGRITVTSAGPAWEMETMPYPRVMGDMLFLPSGDVLIINGAQNGCQGWGNAKNPTLSPVLYQPDAASGSRFVTQSTTTIPRVYHSTANLLPDGRVLVAGSNTHVLYTFTGDLPTELRVEAFLPDFLDSVNDGNRPSIINAPSTIVHGQQFSVTVSVSNAPQTNFGINLISSPFTTHSYSQGLRFLRLTVNGQINTGTASAYVITATAPPTATIAPPSYYMLFIDNQGIPSTASWVQVT